MPYLPSIAPPCLHPPRFPLPPRPPDIQFAFLETPLALTLQVYGLWLDGPTLPPSSPLPPLPLTSVCPSVRILLNTRLSFLPYPLPPQFAFLETSLAHTLLVYGLWLDLARQPEPASILPSSPMVLPLNSPSIIPLYPLFPPPLPLQFAFLETSLALTLLVYGLWLDGLTFAQQEGVALVAVCIVACVLNLVYGAVNVQPMLALIATVRAFQIFAFQ